MDSQTHFPAATERRLVHEITQWVQVCLNMLAYGGSAGREAALGSVTNRKQCLKRGCLQTRDLVYGTKTYLVKLDTVTFNKNTLRFVFPVLCTL